MGNLWEKAKAHPTITAAIVFGVGLLFVILLFGGNKSGGSTVVAPVADNTDASAATALQMANINASVQANATNAALQAALAGTAAQVTDSNNNASVMLANIYAGADTTKYVADLGAKVALDSNASQKAINDANVNGAVQVATIQSLADQNIAKLTTDASTKIAGLQAANVSQQIATNREIAGWALQNQSVAQHYDFMNIQGGIKIPGFISAAA